MNMVNCSDVVIQTEMSMIIPVPSPQFNVFSLPDISKVTTTRNKRTDPTDTIRSRIFSRHRYERTKSFPTSIQNELGESPPLLSLLRYGPVGEHPDLFAVVIQSTEIIRRIYICPSFVCLRWGLLYCADIFRSIYIWRLVDCVDFLGYCLVYIFPDSDTRHSLSLSLSPCLVSFPNMDR